MGAGTQALAAWLLRLCADERWDSARKMWGLVLNRSRDTVRQVRLSAHHHAVQRSAATG